MWAKVKNWFLLYVIFVVMGYVMVAMLLGLQFAYSWVTGDFGMAVKALVKLFKDKWVVDFILYAVPAIAFGATFKKDYSNDKWHPTPLYGHRSGTNPMYW